MRAPARPSLRVGTVALTALVGAVLGAGCGRPAVLDVDRAEARIASSLAETFDIEVSSVRCPDEVRVRAGSTFACSARLEQGSLEVDVRQADDAGALRVEPTQAVLVTARVETDIVEVLADRFSRDDVEVSCPGGPQRLEEPDATFTCAAVDGDERKEVQVRVRDLQGALTYTLQ